MRWEERLDQWRSELALFEQLEGWVPLVEASERTGVSRSALRTWYRTGQVRSRLIDGPHGPQRLVNLAEVGARADASPRVRANAERELALEAQVTLLRHRVEELEIRLSAVEGRREGTP